MPESQRKILVIKLAALGDFVQALGAFSAIARHHQDDHLTLLTTDPYVELARATGLFDQVLCDSKPRGLQLGQWLALRRTLRSGDYVRVYDLQTSDRSSFYRRLFWPSPSPQWSGIARGCSHPHDNPKRDFMHTTERQAEQLQMAGVETEADDMIGLSGLDSPVERFAVPEKFALLAVGGAAHRPEKRWPVENYAKLAKRLLARGLTPVLLGGPAETEAMDHIVVDCPQALNLCGLTSLPEIAGLARLASLSVGNDSGPMHLIAGLGCPSVVLYSHASDPGLCGQRGPKVSYIRKPDLADVGVDEVMEALELA
ncbi:MAG: glycosyltransferase family 9 protein [Rhodospirillaceae bacterium]|jgi:ADP-heptose:LPS heptosyltransferase|nr:glycosyltransferase family 9 protein [Rhodospirillaceae bacterium]MBT5563001.1 glycosyltransferase family 9 protein [Rhodospirillaceae bacterium]MBT6242663.1 glycosyltransferase family 9 protein [Rhodospirillaceae bacterium]MBT7137406.1 glycosyltransferase family 9 protein [Rhodospirillaceae bacterium]